MAERSRDLTALLGSRICHDLISPIGAIGNGLELMAMSGAGSGPELSLINESVSNANARIRFYRVAFGASGDGQSLGRSEIRSILDEITKGARLRFHWEPIGDVLRRDVKLAFLVLQCFETAMPYGGEVSVLRDGPRWTFRGKATKLKIKQPLWDLLLDPAPDVDVAPAEVQFALVPELLAESGRQASVTIGEAEIVVSY